ncbi:uncharacterized protein EV420DRAFT_1646897 [Desarmillaria tabescens]|uniref:Uncharacterized protein n=1 Tax=Armillaria tabescens TaxID=1929756 RepID=A0AA39MXK5_ARMTA|nr:uncharacterized protein EV420DRAFT_1646897 [Desarmillaria tabescens]KAK0449570.1 hypothetical protein EV420DRAFT_1646897 [Desarmillaria tabescens]
MSSQETATKFAAAEGFTAGDNQVAPATNRGLGRGGVGKQKEALKLRLDLNLEVEIAIQAKVNGDITLSLLRIRLVGGVLGSYHLVSGLPSFVKAALLDTR